MPRKPAASGSFGIGGASIVRTQGTLTIDNPRMRISTALIVAFQLFVLCFTVFVQWESMLWFQNVWGFRGRAVAVEIGLQAIVWVGMAFAYGYYDWIMYNLHCRFRATFDVDKDRFVEGSRVGGPLSALALVEIRRRTSVFSVWHEVRLLIHTDDGDRMVDPFRLTHRITKERTVASVGSIEQAHALAKVVSEFVGMPVREA